MSGPGRVHAASIPLMQQLARMANMELSLIRRMVLTLDVNEAPVLQVETYLTAERMETLEEGAIRVEELRPDDFSSVDIPYLIRDTLEGGNGA